MSKKKKRSKNQTDALLEALMLDEEIDRNSVESPEAAYRPCPRCGSKSWKKLFSDVKGRPTFCEECEEISDH